MTRRCLAPTGSLALLLALALAPRTARAQNPAAAEALFEQARAAMAAGSYDIACARFRDSDKLDPAVGTRFNLADCEERRGRVATAWSLFRGVLGELAPDDDRRPIADRRARALEPRLPYVTLRASADTPPGVKVRIDGVELGEGSFGVPLPMDPGEHELVVLSASSGASRPSRFALEEGQQRDVPIHVVAPAPSAELRERQEAPLVDETRSTAQLKWALVAGGVGVAGVALGSAAGVVTLNKKRTADANCDDHLKACNRAGVDANESGRTFGTLSVIGFGIGAAGLLTGAYLWLTAPEQATAAHPSIPARRKARVYPNVVVARQGGFVAISGSF